MKTLVVTLALLWAALAPAPAVRAGETQVAVAANFTEPATEIARLFTEKTGHVAKLSSGASGGFLTQIAQGAPFEVFLSADAARPTTAVADGLAVPGTQFTYAVGALVLWSREDGRVAGPETLTEGAFAKIAIADPDSAPYGAAAIETMKALGVYEALRPRIVRGRNIGQTFQFIDTGNAELGFVALSQIARTEGGSRWIVPAGTHAPILQDAVLLDAGAGSEAAKAFLAFLRGPEARAVIEGFGYGTAAGIETGAG